MTGRSVLVAVVLVAILVLMLSVGVLFLIWPTWLTGGYCELTFTTVSLHPNGLVDLQYDETIAYGSLVEWISIPDKAGHSSSSSLGWTPGRPEFLRWPRRREGVRSRIWISTAEEKQSGISSPETLRRRLILKPGKTRIRIGETFVYCREGLPDGRVAEGTIRVVRDRD